MAVELVDDSKRIEVTDAEIVDGGDKDTTYTLRKVTQATQRELRKKHTRQATYRRQYEQLNEEAFQDDQIDYLLVGWTGVVANGIAVPCERQYKLRLDVVRKAALIERAVIADVVEDAAAKEQSFRPTA